MENDFTLSQAFEGFILDKQAASKSRSTIRNYRVTFKKVDLWLRTTRPTTSPPAVKTAGYRMGSWLKPTSMPDRQPASAGLSTPRPRIHAGATPALPP